MIAGPSVYAGYVPPTYNPVADLEDRVKKWRAERATRVMEIAESIRAGNLPYQPQSVNLKETSYNDFWLTSYVDQLDRYREGLAFAYPLTQPTDRRWGNNFPFWTNEQQLSLFRAQARVLMMMNPNAQGMVNGLCSYTIHKGFTYRCEAKKEGGDETVAKECQKIVDEFIELNDWPAYEQELFCRSREDGEFFLRLFPDQPEKGMMEVRAVEPEQVFMKPGGTLDFWSYGMENESGDVTKIKNFYVSYVAPDMKADPKEAAGLKGVGDTVPGKEMIHYKCNVVKNVKRGMTDFSFDTLELFQIAGKLRRNIGSGAAAQAAIAAIRQHELSTSETVQSFIDNLTDYSIPAWDTNGRFVAVQKMQPGTFLDMPKGMQYVQPPGAANAEAYVTSMQALLRNAANRHNAPEWLVSGDSSNSNYASALVAESPFVKSCQRLQRNYGREYRKVMMAVLDLNVATGRVPQDWKDKVELKVVAPEVESRDPRNQAETDQVYNLLGVKSARTIASEQNLDYDTEKKYIKDHAKDFGIPLPGQDFADDIKDMDNNPMDGEGHRKDEPASDTYQPEPVKE